MADRYTKVVLTVIAIALVWLCFQATWRNPLKVGPKGKQSVAQGAVVSRVGPSLSDPEEQARQTFAVATEKHIAALNARLAGGGLDDWSAELRYSDISRTDSIEHPFDGTINLYLVMGKPDTDGVRTVEPHTHLFERRGNAWVWVLCISSTSHSGRCDFLEWRSPPPTFYPD